MGSIDEFGVATRMFLRAYRWRRIDPVPWTAPRRPIASARVGLVSTAGFVAPGQPPFDDRVRGGDPSWRAIDARTDARSLREFHRSDSFDHAGLAADPNLGFPLDRFRELAEDGVIGEVAPRHLSFMGSITAPGRLVRDTAPEAARLFVEDQVDLALLVPV